MNHNSLFLNLINDDDDIIIIQLLCNQVKNSTLYGELNSLLYI